MKSILLAFAFPLLLSGCGLNMHHASSSDAPKDGYKKVHHTITFDTEPRCVGSCDPSVKSW